MAPKVIKKGMGKNLDAALGEGSEQSDTTPAEGLSPALIRALAIQTADISSMIDAKLDMLLQKFGGIKEELDMAVKRIEEAEQRVSNMEDTLTTADQRISDLEKKMAVMIERLDDQENRGRRKNVRIIGLKDNVEGDSAIRFMEKWIPEFLSLTCKKDRIKLERAHRISGPTPQRSPRVMIVRFHNFADRQLVLDVARRAEDLTFEGRRIHFFQDFAASTQRVRRSFDEVRKKLQGMDMRYYMVYPATLRIITNDSTKSFSSAKLAMDFVNSLSKD